MLASRLDLLRNARGTRQEQERPSRGERRATPDESLSVAARRAQHRRDATDADQVVPDANLVRHGQRHTAAQMQQLLTNGRDGQE
jgi:hypothetical protein